jgi:hypothetical protein
MNERLFHPVCNEDGIPVFCFTPKDDENASRIKQKAAEGKIILMNPEDYIKFVESIELRAHNGESK